MRGGNYAISHGFKFGNESLEAVVPHPLGRSMGGIAARSIVQIVQAAPALGIGTNGNDELRSARRQETRSFPVPSLVPSLKNHASTKTPNAYHYAAYPLQPEGSGP